jgi:transposase
MKRFVEGIDRDQSTLFPECLEDWIDENNPVRVIDVFVDSLDLAGLGFERVDPKATGRPSYHPAVLLKLYVYGYLNQVQSSRKLERECGRNVEVMWLTARLVPDHKTIADFRKDPCWKRVFDTMVLPFARSARSLLKSAVGSACSPMQALPSTDRSSSWRSQASLGRRQQPQSQLYRRQDAGADGADRGPCCTLPPSA